MTEVPFSARVLRETRLRTGMSATQLAMSIGLRDGSRVRAWERGVDQPAARMVPRLAEALGIPAVDLYEVGDGPAPLVVLRRCAGLTLPDVVRRTGLSYGHCQALERGNAKAREGEIEKLAAVLGVVEEMVAAALRK